MRNTFIILLIAFFLALSTHLSAKEDKPKFGKISMDELNQNSCPIDSNAHAFYLFDIGGSHFSYNSPDGFKINYERHFRIKIIDKAGFDNATISIPYYDGGSSKESILNLKAFSYNVEDGKIIKTQLKKADIFDEATTKNWNQIKFAIPNVKEGSVIEVSYNKSSNMLQSLPGWQFQHYIPILRSEYEVGIPEYFHFNQFHRGYQRVNTVQSSQNTTTTTTTGQLISYSVNVFKYTLNDVPAFPVGEKLTTPENYICKVEYELASYQFPGSFFKSFTQTWEDLDKLLLDDDDFGLRLKTTGFLKDDAQAISLTATDEMGKMTAAFNNIKKKIKWNERSSCWTSSTLKKSYETGIGNVADINLNLVALLKELELEAYPVVLSTRSNGMIHPANPSINQMNYVVALCKIDGKSYLLDATEKYSEVNVLPERCLNGEGRIIATPSSGWIPLLQDKMAKSLTSYIIEINEDGKIKGDLEFSDNNYAALDKRSRINNYETVEKYIEKLQEFNPGLTIDSFSFNNLDTTGIMLSGKYSIEIADHVDIAGDLLYFKPLLYDVCEKNPFSLETREYPVEYAYPYNELVVVNIKIPTGYKIESLPKPIKVTAIGNNCMFIFNASELNNILSVTSSITINQTIIPFQYYSDIRGFFEKIVEKHLEQIVLKRAN